MKRILLAIGLLLASIASASATCTGPAILHDFAGTAFNMSLATNAGDGNCSSNMTLIGTLPAFGSTPTFNLGTLNGAATAAKQPALGTAGTASTDVLTVQGIASMTPLLATLSGTNNINNISGTVSLPTGASTAAKQPALGTAGSASSDVITVQGIASMTALKVDGSAVTQPISGSVGRTAGSSTTMQNGATANGNGTNLTVTGFENALVNVNCSVACSGGTTINFEGTDSTGTFFSVAGYPVLGASTAVSTATTSGQFWVPVAGLTSIRARISAYSAGTITVTGTPMYGSTAHIVQVANSNANGQATMANSSPVAIASNQSAVPVSVASGGVASGAIASGAIASGAVASGAYASGAVSSGAYASGSLASGAVVDLTNMSVATGSAPPSKAIYLGANASGATGGQLRGLINCDTHIFKHITTATDTLAVQGVASQQIYICGWRSRAAGTATWFLEDTQSTNANCASTLTQITGVASEVANSGDVTYNPIWGGLKLGAAGRGLCVNSTGTGGVDVDIWYTQF